MVPPLDPEKEQELYLAARRDTWITVHGTELPFDGPGFWEVARRDLEMSPGAYPLLWPETSLPA